MCDATAFLKLTQLAVGTVAQNRTARATERAAAAAHDDAYAGLYTRMYQQDQAAADEMVDRSREALREVGTMNAIFADSGLAGNSQGRSIALTEGAAQADLTAMERNAAARRTQGFAEGAAITAQAQSRINASGRPSLIGTGLQIAAIEVDRRARDERSKLPRGT